MRAIGVLAVLAAVLTVAGSGESDQCYSDFKWGMSKKQVHAIAEDKDYKPALPIKYYQEEQAGGDLLYETIVAGEHCMIFFSFGTRPNSSYEGLSSVGIQWGKPPPSDQFARLEEKYKSLDIGKSEDGVIKWCALKSQEAEKTREKAIRIILEETGLTREEWEKMQQEKDLEILKKAADMADIEAEKTLNKTK
jgi:hypothetical protein